MDQPERIRAAVSFRNHKTGNFLTKLAGSQKQALRKIKALHRQAQPEGERLYRDVSIYKNVSEKEKVTQKCVKCRKKKKKQKSKKLKKGVDILHQSVL